MSAPCPASSSSNSPPRGHLALGRRADLPPGDECDRHALPSDAVARDAISAIRALHGDGGSEFAAAFEQACQQRGIRLFACRRAPPTSMAPPNAPIAPLPRNSTNAIWATSSCSPSTKRNGSGEHIYNHIYNHIRPHQARGYLFGASRILIASCTLMPPSHMS